MSRCGECQVFFSVSSPSSLFPFSFGYSPFDQTYNLVERHMKRLVNTGLKAVVFGVPFLPSKWSGILDNAFCLLGAVTLHKNRELQKSDLAKQMPLSGLLPLGETGFLWKKFPLFLKERE